MSEGFKQALRASAQLFPLSEAYGSSLARVHFLFEAAVPAVLLCGLSWRGCLVSWCVAKDQTVESGGLCEGHSCSTPGQVWETLNFSEKQTHAEHLAQRRT